jgi:hypothetical protein
VVDVIRGVAVSSPVPRIKIPGSAVVLGVVYTDHTVSGLPMSWRVYNVRYGRADQPV